MHSARSHTFVTHSLHCLLRASWTKALRPKNILQNFYRFSTFSGFLVWAADPTAVVATARRNSPRLYRQNAYQILSQFAHHMCPVSVPFMCACFISHLFLSAIGCLSLLSNQLVRSPAPWRPMAPHRRRWWSLSRRRSCGIVRRNKDGQKLGEALPFDYYASGNERALEDCRKYAQLNCSLSSSRSFVNLDVQLRFLLWRLRRRIAGNFRPVLCFFLLGIWRCVQVLRWKILKLARQRL